MFKLFSKIFLVGTERKNSIVNTDMYLEIISGDVPQLASSIELGSQISNMGSPSVMIILP